MIILDTCILIYDALFPEKLSTKVKNMLEKSEKENILYCCDISLWEIAMLMQKKRIAVNTDAETFIELILQARQIEILSITPQIASLSTTILSNNNLDPADRLIAATSVHHQALLITSDEKLLQTPGLNTLGCFTKKQAEPSIL